jgi:hypothetical protein
MDTKANATSAVLLAMALLPSGVQGQSLSTQFPDHFEYSQGHGYMGGESVKWEHEALKSFKRVADMTGKGSFHETAERLEPSPEAWKQFWVRIDSIRIWEWKADYSGANSSLPDGESWTVSVEHGAKRVRSRGYNAVPEAYGAFRDAVRDLMEDGRRRQPSSSKNTR